MRNQDPNTIAANWRCFVACSIVVLSPFQYGLDFGLIGGLQAMPGFLKVCSGFPSYLHYVADMDVLRVDLRSSSP